MCGGISKYKYGKKLSQASKNSYDTVKVNSSINNVVAGNAKIIFKIKYGKSGEVQVEKQESAGKLTGKKKMKLKKHTKM